MVRFGICAGAREAGERLQSLLLQWAELTCLELEITKWETLEDFYGAPAPAECAVLFLDVGAHRQRPLAQRLKSRGAEPELVLLSADPHSAIASYPLHPAGFLKEPVRYEPLAKTLERCFPAWRAGLRWLEAPASRATVRIPLCEVRYAEASGRNCILHCGAGPVQVSRSLGWVEASLPRAPFLRCQKSFIVNLCAVRRFSGGEFVMSDDAVITVGRGQKREVQRRYQELCRLLGTVEQ